MKNSTDEASKQSRRNFAKSVITTFAATPLLSSLTGCREKKSPASPTAQPQASIGDQEDISTKIVARAVRIRASKITISEEMSAQKTMTTPTPMPNAGKVSMDSKDKLIQQAGGKYEWEQLTKNGILKVYVKCEGLNEKYYERPKGDTTCTITLGRSPAPADVVAKIFDFKSSGPLGSEGKRLCRKVATEGPFTFHYCENPIKNEKCHYYSMPTTPDIKFLKIEWKGDPSTITFDFTQNAFEYVDVDLSDEMNEDDCCELDGQKCK